MHAKNLVAATVLSVACSSAFAQPAPDQPGAPQEPQVPAPVPPAAPEPTPVTPPLDARPPVEPAAVPIAAPKAKTDEAPSPLVPAWEIERMKPHPIKQTMAFRPGKGVTFASDDGQFEINTKIRGQALGTFEAEHAAGGDVLTGAQIRRARLAFQGHMFGKHTKYKTEIAISPRDDAMRGSFVGTAPLLDWNMTFDKLKAATLVVGQYKVPFSRQRVVSSGSLQMVDRSIVQSEFNLDRDVGFDLRSTSLLDGRFHYNLGFYPGEGRNAFELRKLNHIYLARVEVLPTGNFQDYVEGDFERTAPRVAIGASYAYVKDSPREQGPLGSAPADAGLTSFHAIEADVLLKAYGFSFTGEFFLREAKRKGGDAVDDMGVPIPVEDARTGLGYFAQAGYLLPQSSVEVSARYGDIRPTGSKTSLPERHEVGVGLSYYFAQHVFKLQGDVFRLWGEDGIADGTDMVRVQLEAGL